MLVFFHRIFLLSLPLIGVTTAYADAESGAIKQLPRDSRVYDFFTLPNQMRVVLVSDSEASQAAAALSVQVGSNSDPDNYLGMAHFVEHMLFMGTAKYPKAGEFDKYLAVNGGSINAMTEKDFTSYFFSINEENFSEGLDRFANFFISPQFLPEYIESELNAVHAEYKMRASVERYKEHAVLNSSSNHDHPSSHFRTGNRETLSNKSNQLLRSATVEFYNTYYSANIMTLVLLGKAPVDKLKALAVRYFSAIENKNASPFSGDVKPITTENKNTNIHIKTRSDANKFYIEFPIPYRKDDYRYKMYRYISYLIDSEMPGTLIDSLRKNGLIKEAFVRVLPKVFSSYGIFRVQFYTTEYGLANSDKIVAATMQYLELIGTKGVKRSFLQTWKGRSISKKYQLARSQL